jgi:16S rRNA (cytosine1402-N4)-methyltransferase
MTIHKSVLLEESIEALNLKEGAVVIDATLGGGGHSREILKMIGKSGKLIAIDADAGAIERFRDKLKKEYTENVILVHDNFRNLGSILEELAIEKVDAILADIGYSSDQLEDPKRGISFQLAGTLDMRFDQKQEMTAEKILNEYDQKDLERIIRDYGEEKFYKNIVRGIIEYRKHKKIERTNELVEIIESHVPARYRFRKDSCLPAGRNPATKTFQGVRIAVNCELDSLRQFISVATGALAPHGRLAVISFHSLEDRIVKEGFRENARGCICPQDFPVCLCGKLANLKILTKKPIMAGPEEVGNNPRSRSAKLRVCEKIEK